MQPSIKRFCHAIAIGILLTGGARAGVLNGHAMALVSGNHDFNGTKAQLDANVDYAVFVPGDFTGALGLPAAEDPSGGSQYVYVYEIFNTGSAILSFSIGLHLDVITAATNWGDAPSGGGVAPYAPQSGFFPGAAPIDEKTNVKWTFLPNIGLGAHSNFLLFTSPYAPGLDTASLVATVGDTNPSLTDYLPSPVVPEPSTFVLAALAAGALLAAGYRRRRKV
jgi:hypothetical protein